jgi:hypothetical protein
MDEPPGAYSHQWMWFARLTNVRLDCLRTTELTLVTKDLTAHHSTPWGIYNNVT